MRKTTRVRAMQRLVLLSAALAGLGPLAATAAPDAMPAARAPAKAASADATDRLIVRYQGTRSSVLSAGKPQFAARALDEKQLGEHLAKARSVAAAHGTTAALLRQTAVGSYVYQLGRSLGSADLQRVIADLKATDPSVEHVEPDRRQHIAFTPDDSRFRRQWPLFDAASGIRARSAWDLSQGEGVVVAVIDTGIRPHRDLQGQYYAGYDFVGDLSSSNDGDGRDGDATDPGDSVAAEECGFGQPALPSSWHGTHVAGTIAAATNNGMGIAGVAYKARVLPVRVLGKCGGYVSDIADGIVWASGGTVPGVPANRHPARVLNLSLGGSGVCDDTYQTAIDAARARGAVVVVAAGNESTDASTTSPSSCQGVIVVGAVGRDGVPAGYSNYGIAVSLSAPGGSMDVDAGGGVLSTLDSGTEAPEGDIYGYYEGTSMATPHVAGTVALMLSVKPSLTASQVRRVLARSARPPAAGCLCGAGLLDAYGAVYAVLKGPGRVVAEVEGNEVRSRAQRVARPATVEGSISSSNDQDWYRVVVRDGGRLGAMLLPSNLGADFDLELYDGNGQVLQVSDRAAGYTDSVQQANTSGESQTYYVHIKPYGTVTGRYQLKLFW